MKKQKSAKEAPKGGDKKKPSGKQVALPNVEGILDDDDDAPKPKNLCDVGATTAKLTKHRPSILDVRKKAKKAPAKHKKPGAAAEGDKQSPTASTLAALALPGTLSAAALKGGAAPDGKKAAADKAQRRKHSAADGGGRDKTGELCSTSVRDTAAHSSGAPGSGQSAIAASRGGTSRILYICFAVAVMAMVVLAGLVVALLSKKYKKKPVAATTSVKADQREAEDLSASSSSPLASSLWESYGWNTSSVF